MSNQIIAQIVKYCRTHVNINPKGKPTNRRTGDGGFYYALIMDLAEKYRREHGLDYPPGLPCYECRNLIDNGETCISMSKSHGTKYFHPICAYRKNII